MLEICVNLRYTRAKLHGIYCRLQTWIVLWTCVLSICMVFRCEFRLWMRNWSSCIHLFCHCNCKQSWWYKRFSYPEPGHCHWLNHWTNWCTYAIVWTEPWLNAFVVDTSDEIWISRLQHIRQIILISSSFSSLLYEWEFFFQNFFKNSKNSGHKFASCDLYLWCTANDIMYPHLCVKVSHQPICPSWY